MEKTQKNINKPKLLVLSGLPASGKSTYAFELVKQGWKRVNKDDLRAMIDGGKWSRQNEKLISISEIALVVGYISYGFNVVVDDTNFEWEDEWKDISKKIGADFEVKLFDVPLMECIERDSKRGDKSVGAKVIQRMYDKYLKPKPPEHKPECSLAYIFDIDGTLAKMNGRSPYDYSLVHTDLVNENVFNIYNSLMEHGYDIIIVSGRTDDCRIETENWLKEKGIMFDSLFMRKAGDLRKDAIIKKEIFDNHIKDKYNILGVFDDRNQCVDMWRSLGLTCFQVEYGFF